MGREDDLGPGTYTVTSDPTKLLCGVSGAPTEIKLI